MESSWFFRRYSFQDVLAPFRKLTFISSEEIRRAWNRYEFFGLIITGPQGIGKSTYALKIAYDIYNDWNTVFNYLIFSMDDLIDLLKKTEGKRIPVIIWDDAGIHGHKYLALRKKKLVQLLQAFIDVIRTKCAAMLVTVPSISELVKPIRESPGFNYCRIAAAGNDERIAKVYKRTFTPPYEYFKRWYEDRFKILLPDDIYKRYMEIRKSFYEHAERELLKYALREIKNEEKED